MVRTRFAPSPTGYLHIGGVRTALFCWLFARQHGGQFILRIDDTDQDRNVAEAIEPILRGLRWLGLDWDEGPEVGGPHEPYFQSQRQPLYQAAVRELIARGAAYYDYARPEEIEAERQAALAEKRPFVYSRRWMAETDADRARFEAEGRRAVVRLKMPREGTLVIEDLVRGRVEFPWSMEQDHVIQRADGTCLYHLASVVDDYEMGITHVIRAEEHLSNTPRQVFIVEALGYPRPQYAHLPFVAEPGSKNKLSKRKLAQYVKNKDFGDLLKHGQEIAARLGLTPDPERFNPVMIEFYERLGYLPEAILNYLALLGWALDDSTEFFTREDLLRYFSLDRVNRAPASFDAKRLRAIQERHMARLSAEEKLNLVLPFCQQVGWVGRPPRDEEWQRLRAVVTAAGERIKVAGDILQYEEFFVRHEAVRYEPEAFRKRLVEAPKGRELLREFAILLGKQEDFSPAALEALLQRFVEEKGIKVSDIIHALRVAVTGKAIGFGMFDGLSILGREEVLARIGRALSLAEQAEAAGELAARVGKVEPTG
ncbi:MAG: glutamate--tRNA ligase [Thermoguttaceae bacterium]|nr:glutamate--tRNA ligase [Thermoguttaceae bacterium]MDW8079057.1 glutamate--tRNA ligase [Thermoguttaceae bacterium]